MVPPCRGSCRLAWPKTSLSSPVPSAAPCSPHVQLCLQKHPEHVAKIMEAGEGEAAAAASSPAAEADAAGGSGSSGAGAAAAAATPRPAQ